MSARLFLTAIFAGAMTASSASAAMEITEWMYGGVGNTNKEFVELTNVGASAVDFTGWSFDDDSALAGTVPLSSLGVVAPGETVIITEMLDADFRAMWGLPASQKVVGSVTTNLGRNDAYNIFDATNTLVEALAFGDQSYPGSFRTVGVSANVPSSQYGSLTANANMPLSFVGDSFGSRLSTTGEIGNPGVVPEPTSLAAAGLLLAVRRRR